MATPTSARRVRCLVCGQTSTLNNLTTHLRAKSHPAYDRTVPRRDLYAEMGAPDVPLLPAPVDRRLSTATNLPAVVEEATPVLPPLGPDDVDDIVLAVVGQVAEPSGAIPVEFLPAVFAWREATATFLRSVRGAD